jgi:hypothetical protein
MPGKFPYDRDRVRKILAYPAGQGPYAVGAAVLTPTGAASPKSSTATQQVTQETPSSPEQSPQTEGK